MTLSPGTRLGPYEITSPLGQGGMGEVYRAKDTRLGRDVAVKVLPQHLSSNAEVRTRFEREAKTISSLNHPHICTLFDVGRESDTDYLVMELVEGETLADRLARGALPTPEVLRIGSQIADALDRAHRAGVVHRDLKPGNVMLTKSGAKLMDFGLARATGLAGPAGGSGLTHAMLTQSPTVAQPLTAEGTIVGTFQYMAPEQLEGKETDARADLWALGCVLHEMATGRRAFDGASQASLIAAIMHVTPPPVSQVASMSPPALDRIVSACLAKDPADRVQNAHDVKLQLQWIAEPASTSTVAAVPALPAAPARQSRLFPWLSLLIGLLGIAAGVIAGLAFLSRKTPVMVVEIPVSPELRLSDYWSLNAISPDGNSVVSAARQGNEPPTLRLWNLNSPEPKVLAGTEGPFFPSWSPDGQSIAYVSFRDRALYRIPASGGSPTKLSDVQDARGLTWGRRDVIVFAPAASGPLYKIPAGGGTPEPVTALDASRGEAAHRFPFFLPDGEHFLYTVLPAGPRGLTVCVGSLGSTKVKPILEAECAPIYADPGYLVFVQDDKVTAQRFDTRKLEVVGERITIGAAPAFSEMTAEPVASASRNGRLLYPVITPPEARLEWLDRNGASREFIALPEGDWNLRALSRDQRSAVATRGGDLWQIDLDRAVATRLLRDVESGLGVAWSPDGRRLAVDARQAGSSVLHLLNAGGSGVVDSVKSVPALFQAVEDWSPDGRTLLVAVLARPVTGGNESGWDLWTVPVDGGSPAPYLATTATERNAKISLDGKWILCQSTADGQVELFIDSFPVPGRRVPVFTGEPDRPVRLAWGREGREVLYSDRAGDTMSLPLDFVGDEVRPGRPFRLFPSIAGLTSLRTRDGERFLASRQSGAGTGPSLRLIVGWTGLVGK